MRRRLLNTCSAANMRRGLGFIIMAHIYNIYIYIYIQGALRAGHKCFVL